MQNTQLAPFHIVGITVRTQNGHENTVTDITGLWQRFMQEGISAKIPNRADANAYAVYLSLIHDYTKPYTMIVGCKVDNLNNVPEGMVGHTVPGGSYVPFLSKGDVTKGSVFNTWQEIWNSDLKRAYTSDIEVYGPKSENLTDAEVDILIAVN